MSWRLATANKSESLDSDQNQEILKGKQELVFLQIHAVHKNRNADRWTYIKNRRDRFCTESFKWVLISSFYRTLATYSTKWGRLLKCCGLQPCDWRNEIPSKACFGFPKTNRNYSAPYLKGEFQQLHFSLCVLTRFWHSPS